MAEVNGLPPPENVELWASRVSLDWPTPSLVSQLTKSRLQELPNFFRKGKLDNMVKVRLLLACLFLPQPQLQQLHAELQEISAAACDDEDEWVRVMGAAVGDYSGQLDLQELVEGRQHSNLVAGTLSTLWEGLSQAQSVPGFRPLQEAWMHPDVLPPEAAGARRSRSPSPSLPGSNPHFTIRVAQDGSRPPLAPPSLSQLLDGVASLTGAALDGKGDSTRRRGPVAGNVTSSMFLPTAHASHTSNVPGVRHAPAPAPAPISTPAAASAGPAASATAAVVPVLAQQSSEQQQQQQGLGSPTTSMPPPTAGVGGAVGIGRQPSFPAIGLRPSKLKSLELQESLQLTAAASKSLKHHGHARGAQQQQGQQTAAQQQTSEAVQGAGDQEMYQEHGQQDGTQMDEDQEQQREEGEYGPDDQTMDAGGFSQGQAAAGQEQEEGEALHQHVAGGTAVGVKRAHSALAEDADEAEAHGMDDEDI